MSKKRSSTANLGELPVYDPEGWRHGDVQGPISTGFRVVESQAAMGDDDRKGCLPRRAQEARSSATSTRSLRGWSVVFPSKVHLIKLRKSAAQVLASIDWWRATNYMLLSAFLIGVVVYDRTRYDMDLRGELSLPHPLDILNELRVGSLQYPPIEEFQRPGYVGVRPGTFRDKYPSTTLAGTSTFDEIFVVTNAKCSPQFEEFARRARAINLNYTRFVASAPHDVHLEDPPLPIHNLTGLLEGLSHAHQAILRRQVGYTWTHYQIWLSALQRGRQRILIMDDTLFPKAPFIRTIAQLFNWVDQESVAGKQPWHLMFFRRALVDEDWASTNETFWSGSESAWSPNPKFSNGVVRAKPSYGAGFYALSLQGLEWILKHFTEYRGPLDIQLSQLQREYPAEFIALSACRNDEPRAFCSELVQDIQLNGGPGVDCVWRRIQELKIARTGSDL